MTDFLDRLIARSAGAGEVIRPRTPSLFEPYSPDSARVLPSAFGNTEFEEPGLTPEAGARPAEGVFSGRSESRSLHGLKLLQPPLHRLRQ